MENIDWKAFGIEIGSSRVSGNVKVLCPQCTPTRDNKTDRSLSCNLATGEFMCHHCGWKGVAVVHSEADKKEWMERQLWFNRTPIRHEKKVYKKPESKNAAALNENALKWFREERCISAATLTAMGVTGGVERMPQDNKDYYTIHFNYYKNGELVNVKYRTGNKMFKLVPGAELLPYNIDAIKDTNECIITEGEIDTLSFYECGRRDVVSVPNGANSNLAYLDDYLDDYFDNKTTIYIASDTDTKGVMLRDELLRRFGPERCKVVEYGEGCKDANDHLKKFGRDSLLDCLTKAKDFKIEGVFSVSDFEQSLDALWVNGMQKGVTIGHKYFDELISFETKRLCVVTGIPGCLDENTLVEMADGTRRRIAELNVGDEVLTLDNDYCNVAKKIINKWDSGQKICYKLATRDGHEITATDEHWILTFEGWKQLKDIKVGEFVGVTRFTTCHKEMNPDILRLAAFWIADGNKHTTSYSISNATPAVIAELNDICKRNNLTLSNNTGIEYIVGTIKSLKADRKRYVSSISYHLRKTKFYGYEESIKAAEILYETRLSQRQSLFSPVDELKKLGCWGQTTHTLSIPDAIMQLETPFIAFFLGSLFACDGSFSNGCIEYSSVSRRLCDDIQILLSRFGISATVREKKVKYNGDIRIAYTVSICAYKDVEQFWLWGGVLGKNDKIGEYLRSHRTSNKCDYVPASAKKMLRYGDKFYKNRIGVSLSKNDKTKVRVNRGLILDCSRLDGTYETVRVKLNNQCAWREIKSIEKIGERHTYDIEVADTHNFFANGIVTHNSGKSEFIDEITERLNINYGWRFAYFSPENSPLSYHASKLIEKFTGKRFSKRDLPYNEYQQAKSKLESDFFFIMPDEFKIDTILEKAKSLVRKNGIKSLVIDPYNRLENEQGMQNETLYVSRLLDKLQNFAVRNDVLVILMVHPTKMKSLDGVIQVPTLYDCSGSANFYNKCDFGLIVHRDRSKEVVEVKVAKVKFKWLGETGSAFFKYDAYNGRYVSIKDSEDTNYTYDRTNHLQTLAKEQAAKALDAASFDFPDLPEDCAMPANTAFDDIKPTDNVPF